MQAMNCKHLFHGVNILNGVGFSKSRSGLVRLIMDQKSGETTHRFIEKTVALDFQKNS